MSGELFKIEICSLTSGIIFIICALPFMRAISTIVVNKKSTGSADSCLSHCMMLVGDDVKIATDV